MVTTVFVVLLASMALVTLFWVVVILVHAYHLRRIVASSRFKAIKSLYGLHFQRRSFLIGGKR